jgi:hypothetical protein
LILLLRRHTTTLAWPKHQTRQLAYRKRTCNPSGTSLGLRASRRFFFRNLLFFFRSIA